MKTIRKSLIGALAVVGALTCVASAFRVVRNHVDLSLCESDSSLTADGDHEGIASAYSDSEDDPPGIARIAEEPRSLRQGTGDDSDDNDNVIDDVLREATPDERAIWRAELAQRSPDEVREILSLHRRLAPPYPVTTAGGLQLSTTETSPPRPLAESSIAPASRLSADALGLIESAIDAAHSGEQVVLNNIANANTIGFKRSRVLYGDMAYRQVALPGSIDQQGHPTAVGIAFGGGVKVTATQTDLSQGRLRHTEQPLDLAIQGDGYFQINDGNRFLYTRAGTFTRNANGEVVLVSKDRGRPLEPAITVPQATIKLMVGSDGVVSVLEAGQSRLIQIGQIQIARFINAAALVARGENLFEPTTGSGNPLFSIPGQNATGEIQQGYLEESNVVVANELAELRRLQGELKTLRQLHAEFSGTSRTP